MNYEIKREITSSGTKLEKILTEKLNTGWNIISVMFADGVYIAIFKREKK